MSLPVQRKLFNDFSGGKVSFPSPLDIRDNQFQEFDELENEKIGRVEKVSGDKNVSNKYNTAASAVANGQGFIVYRTEWNNDTPELNVSTLWFVIYRAIDSTDRSFIRYDVADDTSGSWEEIGLDETVWTDDSVDYLIDMFEHNQILRISDGRFEIAGALKTANKSKWYGYIGRNVFGQSYTFDSGNKFKEPDMAIKIDEWVLENTEITPPTVVQMQYAFDADNGVTSADYVGICIHYPAETSADPLIMADLPIKKFGDDDRYTVTFLYDYVQESALAKDSNGKIGVTSRESSGDGKTVPCIQLVVHTGAALADWNKRITGINLYWQPEGDVDWYLLTYLDIENGWTKSSIATEGVASPDEKTYDINMGHWIPCPEGCATPATTNYTRLDGGDEDTWTDTAGAEPDNGFNATSYAQDKFVFSILRTWGTTPTLAQKKGDLTSVSAQICTVKSRAAATLELGYGGTQSIAALTHRGEKVSAPDNTYFTYADTRATDKVATWYIPNDGIFGLTYHSFTGRHAGKKIPAIRWNASAVGYDRAFYLNVDTEDENEQTVRERSRVYFTPKYQLDVIDPLNYEDFGRGDSDIGVGLAFWGGRLFVFKRDNIYIKNVSPGVQFSWTDEGHYQGYGCSHKHTIVTTPWGIVFADDQQVSILTPGMERPEELTLPIRAEYRALTFDNPVIGYSASKKQLHVVTDTSGSATATRYKFDFDTRDWKKQTFDITEGMTNFQLGDNVEPVYGRQKDEDAKDTIRIRELNDASTTSSAAAKLKTKRFDGNAGDYKKRWKRLYVTYKSSSVALTCNIYLDGSGTASKTITFAASSTLVNVGDFINRVSKTIEIEFTTTSTDFIIDDFILEYTILGHKP